MCPPGLAKFDSASVFEPGFGRWHDRQRPFHAGHHEIIER